MDNKCGACGFFLVDMIRCCWQGTLKRHAVYSRVYVCTLVTYRVCIVLGYDVRRLFYNCDGGDVPRVCSLFLVFVRSL